MNAKPSIPTIAIIGGGFCGTMLLVNLIRKAPYPLSIALIERSSHIGKGIAYGTPDPNHVLNVPAIKMGAFANNPEHFFQWAEANEALWREADASFADLKLDSRAFFPRRIYALYLNSLLKEAVQEAIQKNIHISIHTQEAIDLKHCESNQLCILFQDGKNIKADAAILAIGLPPSKRIDLNFTHSNRYVRNIWAAEPDSFWQKNSLSSLPSTTKIAVLGSGLTMVDAVITLLNHGYKGIINIISKHGVLPEKHRNTIKNYPIFLNSENCPHTALKLLKTIRQEILMGHEKGYDWRSVIDALRSVTPAVWGQLPLIEKRKILRYLFSIWNRHRHRTAPACLEKIEQAQGTGHLRLIAGEVNKIAKDNNFLVVNYYSKNSNQLNALPVHYVINCTGSEMNLNKNDNQLVQNLLKNGYIQPDALNLGIQANSIGAAQGKASQQLFVVGQLLFGERFETIAVPELRAQCDQVTEHLLSTFTSIVA